MRPAKAQLFVQFSGELKIKEVRLNPELIDFDDMEELEHWIKGAVARWTEEAQKIAAEKDAAFNGRPRSGNVARAKCLKFYQKPCLTQSKTSGNFPGLVHITAERYAYHLLKGDALVAEKIARSLNDLHKNVKSCPVTFALISKRWKRSQNYTQTKHTTSK